MEVAQALSNPSNRASGLIAAWDGRPAQPQDASSIPAARYRPRQVQNRLAADAVAELVAMYQVGATIEELAVQFKVNRTTVMGHLDRAGVETRYRRLDPHQIEEAARLYAEGWSLTRLGQRFDVSHSTILNAFRKAGVKTRSRAGAEGPP